MSPDTRWPRLHPALHRNDRSLEERARAVEGACRTAMQLLEGVADRRRNLGRVDPVPHSTRAHLRRLAARSRGA